MKKFDISNLTVTNIDGIYKSSLAIDNTARAVASTSLIIVKQAGRSTYDIKGERLVADNENVLFIPCGAEYEIYVEREGECTVIELTVANAEKLSAAALYTGGDKEIFDSVKDLFHYWTLRGPAYRSKCLSELYGLLTQISSIQSFSSSLAGKYRLIHRSVKFIEANYNRQDLYTPVLAEMSGTGETYYRSIFIAVFGIAPTKYIQQYRVNKAKELLIRTGASVEDIAIAVGFANSSYFCKVFKSITGVTPSDFAEKGRLVG